MIAFSFQRQEIICLHLPLRRSDTASEWVLLYLRRKFQLWFLADFPAALGQDYVSLWHVEQIPLSHPDTLTWAFLTRCLGLCSFSKLMYSRSLMLFTEHKHGICTVCTWLNWTNKCLMVFYFRALWAILTFRYDMNTLNKPEYYFLQQLKCIFLPLCTWLLTIIASEKEDINVTLYCSLKTVFPKSILFCTIAPFMTLLKYSVDLSFFLGVTLIFLFFTDFVFAVWMSWSEWDGTATDLDGSTFCTTIRNSRCNRFGSTAKTITVTKTRARTDCTVNERANRSMF